MNEQNSLSDEVAAWFNRRVPEGWFSAPVRTLVDKDEILVVGSLATGSDAGRAEHEAVATKFRADTKADRISIALAAEDFWQRKVSWAVEIGDVQMRFTTTSVPVMTRLRIDERLVLDTLVETGVARSRSHALAWCVRLVGQHQGDWIDRLRDAMADVERIRSEGPNV
ncbi:MAG: hypothetical protein R2770_12235 [Acidimicrobiales bacterium]